MEIIAMGVFCVLGIVAYYCERRNMKKRLDAAYKAEDKRLLWDYKIESELEHKLQCSQNAERKLGFKVAMLERDNKQLQSDITCFRAELGLGPRLYDDSAMVHIPHWGLPMMPHPSAPLKGKR